jgi:hypothetical protein
MYVLKTPENKKVVINPKTDETLYSAPVNPPNTGTTYTTGTDLLCHVARSGKIYYYTYDWSMWQGTEDKFTLISEEEAKNFLCEAASYSGHMKMTEKEIARAQELFPGIFEEDA